MLGDDCAKVHVLALDETKVPSGQSLLTTVDFTWETPCRFCAATSRTPSPPVCSATRAHQGTLDIPVPATETEKITGVKFAPLGDHCQETSPSSWSTCLPECALLPISAVSLAQDTLR